MEIGDRVRVNAPLTRFEDHWGVIVKINPRVGFPIVVQFCDRWWACFAERELELLQPEAQGELFG